VSVNPPVVVCFSLSSRLIKKNRRFTDTSSLSLSSRALPFSFSRYSLYHVRIVSTKAARGFFPHFPVLCGFLLLYESFPVHVASPFWSGTSTSFVTPPFFLSHELRGRFVRCQPLSPHGPPQSFLSLLLHSAFSFLSNFTFQDKEEALPISWLPLPPSPGTFPFISTVCLGFGSSAFCPSFFSHADPPKRYCGRKCRCSHYLFRAFFLSFLFTPLFDKPPADSALKACSMMQPRASSLFLNQQKSSPLTSRFS